LKAGRKTKALLSCGAVAGPLFVAAFLVEGAARLGYDPLRHPVSSLVLDDHGWMQTANFGVASLLTLAFAAGLRLALWLGKSSTWGRCSSGCGRLVCSARGSSPPTL
jgi:hypothetical protein